MIETKTFRHRQYELLCSAQAVDSGRFVPTLQVMNQAWPRRPRVIAMERGHHVTPETAIESAYTQGVEWVSNYG